MQLDAPIIIIGCGRSGSTLLDRVLNAHPNIHMLGETNFLTTQLWNSLQDSSDGSMWNFNARRAHASRSLFRSGDSESNIKVMLNSNKWQEHEKHRIGSIVNQAVAGLFQLLDIDKQIWGMKEIWNGGAKEVDWKIYDCVYPNAIWLHVVRHPLGYVRSAIGWEGKENTEENIIHQLKTWSRIVRKSQERITSGRYLELRYEDLMKNPHGEIEKIIDRVGLDWSDECLKPLRQNWVATKELPIIDQENFLIAIAELGIKEMVEKLGYKLNEFNNQQATTYIKSVEYDHSGNLVISHGIQQGIGPYWIFVLSTAPAIRDEIERVLGNSSLSNITIFENGIPLSRWSNPEKFYTAPIGSFFCNDSAIIFTSSDGSDPLLNGRSYAISVGN